MFLPFAPRIEKLGFKWGDTKILLISHAHGDHDAGTAVVKKQTGAKLMVMDADVPDEESTARGRPGAHVDKVLHDGDAVELGGSKLTAHLTPGHTKGCTTWTMQEREGGKTLNVVIVGSPNVNPGYILVGNTKYPQIAEDYVKTFAVLKSLPCDIFLGAHGAYFGMLGQVEKMKAGGPNPFIDPDGYRALHCRARGHIPARNGSARNSIQDHPRLRNSIPEPKFMRTQRLSIGLFAILLCVLGLAAGRLQAQDDDINWLGDYREALKVAKETQKPIFIEFRCEA